MFALADAVTTGQTGPATVPLVTILQVVGGALGTVLIALFTWLAKRSIEEHDARGNAHAALLKAHEDQHHSHDKRLSVLESKGKE